MWEVMGTYTTPSMFIRNNTGNITRFQSIAKSTPGFCATGIRGPVIDANKCPEIEDHLVEDQQTFNTNMKPST